MVDSYSMSVTLCLATLGFLRVYRQGLRSAKTIQEVDELEKLCSQRLTAANLAKLPLLLSQPGSASRRITDRWFTRGDATANPAMVLGSAESIKAMAIAGLGCGILPELAVGSEDRSNFTVRPLSPPLSRTLGVVIRKDKRLSKGLKAAYDALLGLRKR